MTRTTGVTVAAVLTYSGAIVLALGSFAFFLVGVMVATGEESGQPVSIAIVGMALAGGFSLLILALVATWLAMNAGELREWARTASLTAIVARVAQTCRSASLATCRSWFVEFLSSHKSRRLEHNP